MPLGAVYLGEQFFRPGESFRIVKHSEALIGEQRPHSHDFVEICYVCEGMGYHEVGEETYRVAKGDLFLINYEVKHAFYRDPEDEELVTYNLLFLPGFMDDSLLPFSDFSSLTMSYLFKDSWKEGRIRENLRLNAEEQREFDELIGKMEREYNGRLEGYNAVLRAYMIELIVKMMRGYQRRSAADERQPRRKSEIEAVLRYLDTHYREPFRLAELAKRTFFSKNYFSQLFKETTGMTAMHYLQLVRIEEACRMMLDPEKKIAQIALDVGYADYKAFYLAFKKQKGVSPHEYRSGLTP